MIEMKHSGIDWIGEIPAHWDVKRLKDVCEFRTGYTPSKNNRDFWEGGNIPWFRMDDIRESGRFLKEAKQTITEIAVNEAGLFEAGSFILATTATIGEHAMLIVDSLANQQFTNLKIRKSLSQAINKNYFFYYLFVIDDYCKATTRTTTFPAVNMNELKIFVAVIPPIEEQQTIADYLDKKTAEIDKQVELLDQKQKAYQNLKASLINQVVTRGLNPNAPLRNSEIDWIGEIPAHWEVKRFKAFAKTIKGKSLDALSEPYEGSLKVLSVECLRQDEAQFYDYVFESDKNQICTPSDIVVIWDGAGVGEFLKAKDGVLSSTIAKIKFTTNEVLPSFFWHWRYKIEYRLKSIPTGMGIPHLNPNLLNNFKIAIPPIKEQQAIADYLDEKTAEIDKNILLIEQKINAYKYLKQSLIDEVVTGKRKI